MKDYFSEFPRNLTEVSEDDQERVASMISTGLNPNLLQVAGFLKAYRKSVRRDYMLSLVSPEGRPAEEHEVDRAIAKVDGTELSVINGEKEQLCKKSGRKSKALWPNPSRISDDRISQIIEELEIEEFDELPLVSPDGYDFDTRKFIDYAYYGVDKPIFIGSNYSGKIAYVEEFLGLDDTDLESFGDKCICNPMKRKLTSKEIDSGEFKAGGRGNLLASPKLDVITFECDKFSCAQQRGIIGFIEAYFPLCYVVDSKGKSLHATFSLRGLTRKQVDRVRKYLGYLGADVCVLKPCQLSRLGGARRGGNGKVQDVLYMDKEARSMEVDVGLYKKFCRLVCTAHKHLNTCESNEELVTIDSEEDACHLPLIKSTAECVEVQKRDRRQIIQGLMRVGHKAIISASSKAGKTWLLINLGVLVSAGKKWLGYQCNKVPVLFVNFELLEDEFIDRVKKVKGQLGLEEVNFDVLTLRDIPIEWEKLTEYLSEHCAQSEKEYGLIILDPIYKMLGDVDENANGDVGRLLAALGQLAKATRTAVIFSHHHSKGGKANVNILDRMSGAGCWARDPDLIIDLVEHEKEGCYTVDAVPRAFRQPKARVVRKSFPVFEIEPLLSPGALKKAGGSKRLYKVQNVIAAFYDDSEVTNAELIIRLGKNCIGQTTAKKLILEAEDSGAIRSSPKQKGKTHTWTLVDQDEVMLTRLSGNP